MADQKLTELATAATANNADLMYIVQSSASKKIAVSSLVSSIAILLNDTSSFATKAFVTSTLFTITSPDNYWNVDPSRTDTYTADGSLAAPFKTITAALNYIENRITSNLLTINISGSIVDNPQFVVLKSSTTEDVTLTRGHVYIIGETPDAGHVPIWIHGHVTITPATSGITALTVNHYGLFNVAVIPTGAYHGIEFNGTNAGKVYLQGVYVYQGNASKSCMYSNNTGSVSGSTSRMEILDCTVGRESGSTYLIDVQRGYAKIDKLETNGTGQVLNFANAATGTMTFSSIDANTGAVVTLSGTTQFGMGSCILNNTGTAANTHGVAMSGSASMQFGVCTFNIPVGDGSNRAIYAATSANTVLYTSPIFQYGSTNKISTAAALVPLTTTFTAV
jgi:hypothetical protein